MTASNYSIHLKDIDDVKRFVYAMNQFPGETELHSGRHIVDAKSIMGVFSLDLSTPVSLQLDGAEEAIEAALDNIKDLLL